MIRLTRAGHPAVGNPEPDPHYLEIEMGTAAKGLVFGDIGLEWEVWPELEFLEEEEDETPSDKE